MKANWMERVRLGFLTLFLLGAGASVVGCADEYVAYPGYRGGYYASYSGYSPYYGYGHAPYRYYGPYYGSPYYGAPYPYYGAPFYGGGAVVISGSRDYAYRSGYRRGERRSDNARSRKVTRRSVNRRAPATRYENDDERRYYAPH
jgi:hypothetical protein